MDTIACVPAGTICGIAWGVIAMVLALLLLHQWWRAETWKLHCTMATERIHEVADQLTEVSETLQERREQSSWPTADRPPL